MSTPNCVNAYRRDLHGTSPDLSARMLREAQAMARLSHPHVVAVYDVGLQDGAVYLVMEYVHGDTLSGWLHASPRSTQQILKAFGDAGRRLLAAHENGLVHLDFKPENVLVAADGRALVTDFGLARETEISLSRSDFDGMDTAELYAPTRGLVGTPAYMAPELFDGGRATASSDQFAFCVALFTAIFERHPFRAGEGITLEELTDQMRAGAVEMNGLRGPNAGQSERLLTVLKRGLAPKSSGRFQDLSELLSALESAARKPWRGRLWAAAVASALLLAASWAVRSWSARPSETPQKPVAAYLVPAPTTDAAPLVVAPSPTAPAPAPDAPRATTLGPTTGRAEMPAAKRRPQRKKVDVRYRDWLKDPFSK